MDLLLDSIFWVNLFSVTLIQIALGADNLIIITILAGKLPPKEQHKAVRWGLILAMSFRLILLAMVSWVLRFAGEPFHHFDSTIWNDLDFRDDDIIIATYAKSGTTWLQQIVSQLIFNGEEGLPVAEMSPWLDLRVPPKEVKLPMVEAQQHRRFLKTHLPVDALRFSPQAKYIYIARDGRDVEGLSRQRQSLLLDGREREEVARVELDVQRTADGRLVLLHDDELDYRWRSMGEYLDALDEGAIRQGQLIARQHQFDQPPEFVVLHRRGITTGVLLGDQRSETRIVAGKRLPAFGVGRGRAKTRGGVVLEFSTFTRPVMKDHDVPIAVVLHAAGNTRRTFHQVRYPRCRTPGVVLEG